MPPEYPELHFRLGCPIDANKYNQFQCRIYTNQADSCTVRWYPQQVGQLPGMAYLPPGWKVVTIPLGLYSGWGGTVTDFYLKFPGISAQKIRLAWAKLTTR